MFESLQEHWISRKMIDPISEIVYLGPEGTFSEQATAHAASIFGAIDALFVPKNGIAMAAEACRAEFRAGVLPYYNLFEGVVQETLDGIVRHNLLVHGLVRLPITFWAGTSGQPDKITEIRSHPKGLAQCSQFIRETFPDAAIVATGSTAEAAEYAASHGNALALASSKAIESTGLNVFSKDAGDRRYGQQNFTDFLLVAGEGNSIPTGDKRKERTLVLIAPELDKPGLLAGILQDFASNDINLTKLHSRPGYVENAKITSQPQSFFMELECAPNDDRLLTARKAILNRLARSPNAVVKILGGFAIYLVQKT